MNGKTIEFKYFPFFFYSAEDMALTLTDYGDSPSSNRWQGMPAAAVDVALHSGLPSDAVSSVMCDQKTQ